MWLMWNLTDKTGYKNPAGRRCRSQARVKVKPGRNKVVFTMTWLENAGMYLHGASDNLSPVLWLEELESPGEPG